MKYSNAMQILFRIDIFNLSYETKMSFICILTLLYAAHFCLPIRVTFSLRSGRGRVQVCLEFFSNQKSIFCVEINFLRKIKKNFVVGNASCIELEEDLLRLPDADLPKEGKAFKLNCVSFLYQQAKY